MKRTQIYLDDDISSFLEHESRTAHRSISEIIRESVRDKYRCKSELLLNRLDAVFGIWRNRNMDVDAHVRNLRKDRSV